MKNYRLNWQKNEFIIDIYDIFDRINQYGAMPYFLGAAFFVFGCEYAVTAEKARVNANKNRLTKVIK